MRNKTSNEHKYMKYIVKIIHAIDLLINCIPPYNIESKANDSIIVVYKYISYQVLSKHLIWKANFLLFFLL